MALGHLDELQKAEKYPIRWSLYTGFTVLANCYKTPTQINPQLKGALLLRPSRHHSCRGAIPPRLQLLLHYGLFRPEVVTVMDNVATTSQRALYRNLYLNVWDAIYRNTWNKHVIRPLMSFVNIYAIYTSFIESITGWITQVKRRNRKYSASCSEYRGPDIFCITLSY